MQSVTSAEITNVLEEIESLRARRNGRRYATQAQVQNAVRLILEKAQAREYRVRNGRAQPMALCKMVRGILAVQGKAVVGVTAEADAAFVRSLATSGVPGQYLVPVIQSDEIIAALAQVSTVRAAGCRVWPMVGIQTMDLPIGLVSPTAVWMAQNSRQTADTATNFGQSVLDLKTCTSLLILPAQLFKVAHPGFDLIFQESFSLAIAEAEDAAVHAASTLANAPLALMSQAGISLLNAGNNNANGGNLAYGDLISVLQKSIDSKVRGPLAWFMAGRSLNRCLSLQDSQSRPLLLPIPEMIGAGAAQSAYGLIGWPVFPTVGIPVNEAVGSGSGQSHAVLCPPRSLHIGESGEISMDVSLEFAFDSDQAAIRISHKIATAYAPAASLVVLQGIN